MRPIARQSARLASGSWKRQSSSPRPRKQQQNQAFHTSFQRSWRDPNSQSHHQTPVNERREQDKEIDNELGKQEESEQDGRKPGAWTRGPRQRRVDDVPKPPPIPDWFLEHNVKLLKESPGLSVNRENGQVIRCVDAETGHTLFTVPYYDAWPVASQNERQEGGRDKKKNMKHEQKADLAAVDSAESVSESHNARAKGKDSFDQHFFDQKFQMSRAGTRTKQAKAKDKEQERPETKEVESSADPALLENSPALDSKSNPMRWVFLEAETSAQAALSLLNNSQPSTSFIYDRVDMSLHCPDSNSHDQMDEFVRDLSRIVEADLIRLDANDFAELAAKYVGHGHDDPGSYSTLGYDVYNGYKATTLERNPARNEEEEEDEDDMDEDNELDEDEREPSRPNALNNSLFGLKISNMIQGVIGPDGRPGPVGIGFIPNSHRPPGIRQRQRSVPHENTRDDAKLSELLDQLLDAPKQKHIVNKSADDAASVQRRPERKRQSGSKDETGEMDRSYQRILRYWRSNPAFWLPETAKLLVGYLVEALRVPDGKPAFTLSSESRGASEKHSFRVDERRRTIVHVRDIHAICASSPLGENIIKRLVKVVRKRRRSGEKILIVGTTAQDVEPFRSTGGHMDEFRSIDIPPFFNFTITDDNEFDATSTAASQESLNDPAYRRILEINCRHIQTTLRRLRPDDKIDLISASYQMNLPGMHFLTEEVLPLDQVQRLALIATGLSQVHAKADTVKPIHVALAGFVMTQSDHAKESWAVFDQRKQAKKAKLESASNSFKGDGEGESTQARVNRLKKVCNPHETRLLSGMVDPQNIKTTFTDVHAPIETIDALKTLTTLSLLRPDAFKYGVLANDRLPGLLLYGPPGTGKTLLAKAVAKESKAAVLEVSGAQIYEKYVGEGEKMVRAVFSLAKKLSPCVVFIDEADAIFGSRGHAGNRNTHREIINQFLREWDGMDDHSVFMMVASNRPFDLDDAVLRRLPRRLLVDLPVAKDRESILGIHLKNEALDSSVSLSQLAEQTPLYSGSDLKNLSVAAALACVREENELAEANKDDSDFKLPDKRVLTLKHFDKALAEISASISEDMSSLTAIRKFDEQFGDRKGRRKKTGYGFGMDVNVIDEGAARVRTPPPPSP